MSTQGLCLQNSVQFKLHFELLISRLLSGKIMILSNIVNHAGFSRHCHRIAVRPFEVSYVIAWLWRRVRTQSTTEWTRHILVFHQARPWHWASVILGCRTLGRMNANDIKATLEASRLHPSLRRTEYTARIPGGEGYHGYVSAITSAIQVPSNS